MNRAYELPPWLAYAGFGVLNLAAMGGLVAVVGLDGLAWLGLAWVCQRATRAYAAYRASLPEEPAEELEEPPPDPAAEPVGACGPAWRLRAYPVLMGEHPFVFEPAEVHKPARTAGS